MRMNTVQFKGIVIERDVPNSDVPCGACAECCTKLSPYLTIEEFSSGNYAYTFVKIEGADMPVIAIPKNKNGGCMYFIDNKCSIYESRPKACRQFDCRNPETSHPKIPNKFA